MESCIDCGEEKYGAYSEVCPPCYNVRRRVEKDPTYKRLYRITPMPEALSNRQTQILTGHLLGDFHITNERLDGDSTLSCDRSPKDRTYMDFELETFKDFCSQNALKESTRWNKQVLKWYETLRFHTRSHPEFSRLRAKWYRKRNGKTVKTIPHDLELTPLVCAIWFCDDGTSSLYGKHKQRLRISLATESFTKKEVMFLADLLEKETGAKFVFYRKTKRSKQYVLFAYHDEAIKFINYILPDFPKSMDRKTALWRKLGIIK